MQKITRCDLLKIAKEKLSSGEIDRVLGWKKGEFDYDITPAVFKSFDELENDFVFGNFCGANLSKYAVSESHKEGKILVFLKPCDTYSFNQLLTEHRIIRENVVICAIPCDGMFDMSEIRKEFPEAVSVDEDGETVTVHTLYDGDFSISREKCLPERCINCKSKKHVCYDILLGEDGEILSSSRFSEVEKLEKMTTDERFDFWQNELSRCIRCNACRNVCPACTCEKCVFDNPKSGVENKAAADSFEEKMFHIIRAFHVAGRCTDCGECSRVCPQNIPLHLLNRKFIKDINLFYGDYQAGEIEGSRNPLLDFTKDDGELFELVGKDGGNA